MRGYKNLQFPRLHEQEKQTSIIVTKPNNNPFRLTVGLPSEVEIKLIK